MAGAQVVPNRLADAIDQRSGGRASSTTSAHGTRSPARSCAALQTSWQGHTQRRGPRPRQARHARASRAASRPTSGTARAPRRPLAALGRPLGLLLGSPGALRRAPRSAGARPTTSPGRWCLASAPASRSSFEQPPQLVLRRLQPPALACRQRRTRSIDVEREHRHRRAERVRLAPSAPLRRALERPRDAAGIFPREHARIEIQRIARFCHMLGPASARHRFAFRSKTSGAPHPRPRNGRPRQAHSTRLAGR